MLATTPPLDETETPPHSLRRRRARFLTEWIVVVIGALVVSMLFRTLVFQTFYIPSKSMKPTLHGGDRIIVNKLSVEFGSINIGDIIVFKAPQNVSADCGDPITDLVKRVIGLPGDHLTSKGNTIYINGQALKEQWPHWEPLGPAIGHVTVADGHYFVMGDNHNNSCDSRWWGTIPKSDIIGKVFVRVWPPSRISWI